MDGREMEIDGSVPDENMNNASCTSYFVVCKKCRMLRFTNYNLVPFLKQSVKPRTDYRKLKTRNV
ncbi:hypothetical protein Lal_00039142 [Lupinus albus]|uniref:Uncharacterized protein n=1 Tax=Lupinus albus TaxID=3870 RepID=A0A6A4NHE0_LUPAL|nr:hypothetical protein Lalb_Chr20g0119491 [Lupinus albus]KAF1882494.1 hypothetical protein Lal_00039142 [Lupinus albus]